MPTLQPISAAFDGHWSDSLIQRIRNLPIPSWLFYLLLFLVTVLVFCLINWVNGRSDWGVFHPVYFISGLYFTEYLVANHFLVVSASSALREFSMTNEFSEEEYERRLFEFTHIPRLPAHLWSLGGALVGVVLVVYAFKYLSPAFDISLASSIPFSSLGFLFFFLAIYRIFHQMKIVVDLFASIETIDLYDLGSIYALALFPVRIVFLIFLAIWLNPFFIIFPGGGADPLLQLFFAFLSLAAAVVIFPLRGVSGRLKDVKEALLRENGRQLTAIREELYQRLRDHDTNQIAELEKGINALFAFRNSIEAISTLPWKSETIRWLVTVLFLPLLLLILQFLLQRFFIG